MLVVAIAIADDDGSERDATLKFSFKFGCHKPKGGWSRSDNETKIATIENHKIDARNDAARPLEGCRLVHPRLAPHHTPGQPHWCAA